MDDELVEKYYISIIIYFTQITYTTQTVNQNVVFSTSPYRLCEFSPSTRGLGKRGIATGQTRLLQNQCLYTTLAEADPEVHKLVELETWRQFSGLELIASEVSRSRPNSES